MAFFSKLILFTVLIVGASAYKFLPLASSISNSAVNQTLVIAVGGFNGSSPTNSVEIYSLTTNSHVQNGVSAPDVQDGAASVILNNTIYVFGGFNGKDFLNTTWSYDIGKNEWMDNLPPMPNVVFGGAAVELDGKIYVLGNLHSTERSKVLVFDPQSQVWKSFDTPLPETSNRPCAVVVGKNGLYFLSERNLYYSNDCAKTWQRMSPPGIAHIGAACAAIGDDAILVAGGFQDGSHDMASNLTEIYNVTTNTWHLTGSMNSPRARASAVSLLSDNNSNNVLVCGGESGGSDETITAMNTCEAFDSAKQEWSNASFSLSEAREFFTLFVTQIAM